MAITKERKTRGIILTPDDVGVESIEGEIKVALTAKKLQVYLDSALRNVVTETQSQSLTNKTVVVASNTITTAASGNLAATELNAALAELQSSIDTSDSALTTHEADTSTHGVSTIAGISEAQALTNKTIVVASNTITTAASGNLAATELNTALAELQTDIDTRATSTALTDHINDSADAHAGTAITNTPSGNLAATTVQGALNELQTDVDTRATSTALSNHESDVSTHGVAVAIVGTTETQTLTNKTLTSPVLNSPSIVTPSRADVKQDTKANLITYASTASNGQLVFATDEKLMYQVVDSALVTVGGGSGSLETIFQLLGDDVPDWSTGDNATFLGGGTLAGTFVADTSTPLQGLSSYVYTQAAGSVDDYLAAPTKAVDLRFRGQECTLYFPYSYDGANNDIEVIFYDDTNNAVIPSSAFIQASTNGLFKTNIVVPLTCESIIVGFQTRVLDDGAIFEFTSVQLSSDTTVYADLFESGSYIRLNTSNGYGSTATKIRRFTNIQDNVGSDVTYVDSATLGGTFTINNAGTYSISYTDEANAVTNVGITKNASSLTTSIASIATSEILTFSTTSANSHVEAMAWTGDLVAGDIIRAHTDGVAPGAAPRCHFTIKRLEKTSSNILTAPETFSTDTAPLVYASSATYTLATLANAPVGTFLTFTYGASGNTRTQTTTAPTQTTSDMNTNGMLIYARAYNAASVAANPAAYAIQIGKGLKGKSLGLYKAAAKVNAGNLEAVWAGNSSGGILLKDYNEVTGILIVDAGYNWSAATTSASFNFSDTTVQNNGYLVINASKNPALTGLNINKVYLEAAGNAGQVLTQDVTNIPFITVVDTHGAWNGSQYTVPETSVYAVTGHVTCTTSAARTIDLYIGGVFNCRVADIITSTQFHFSVVKNFTKNQVVSLRITDSATLNNISTVHYLTITKVTLG